MTYIRWVWKKSHEESLSLESSNGQTVGRRPYLFRHAILLILPKETIYFAGLKLLQNMHAYLMHQCMLCHVFNGALYEIRSCKPSHVGEELPGHRATRIRDRWYASNIGKKLHE